MRRPPDVGKAALCIGLMLGISGCAEFHNIRPEARRGQPAQREKTPRRRGCSRGGTVVGPQSSAPPSNPARYARDRRTIPGSFPKRAESATSPWPETQSEWAARNLPSVQPILERHSGGTRPASPDTEGVTWTNRLPEQSLADERAVTASAPRSDGAIRPTEGASLPAAAARCGGAGSRPRNLDELPLSSTPPPVRSPREQWFRAGRVRGSGADAIPALFD